MKAIKIIAVIAVVLGIGIGNVNAKALSQSASVEEMVKEVKKDLMRSFLDEDISQFVVDGKKTKVIVTLRVCKNSCIEVLKVEGATEEIQKLVKKTINSDEVKTDEICRYRRFRVPLTFVYRK